MIELELLGLGADGESLVFTAESGERFTTPITDELRGALRRERPHLDVAPDAGAHIKPSHIQTLLRAGMTAEEIAAAHHVDLELVERFEAPIQAEKNYILQRAQDSRVGGEPDGPRLGDLVVDRLATRAVSPSSLQWQATRQVDAPWEVCLLFIQGAAEYAAHWTFDAATSTVEAVDQEARWLTETTANAPLNSIFPPLNVPAFADEDPAVAAADSAQREALVEQLNAARGKRVSIDLDLDEEDDVDAILASIEEESTPTLKPNEHSISARIYSLAQAKTKREMLDTDENSASADSSTSNDSNEPSEATSASKDAPQTLPGLDEVPVDDARAKDKKRTKRRSVPSWDEIVFGSKPQ